MILANFGILRNCPQNHEIEGFSENLEISESILLKWHQVSALCREPQILEDSMEESILLKWHQVSALCREPQTQEFVTINENSPQPWEFDQKVSKSGFSGSEDPKTLILANFGILRTGPKLSLANKWHQVFPHL